MNDLQLIRKRQLEEEISEMKLFPKKSWVERVILRLEAALADLKRETRA